MKPALYSITALVCLMSSVVTLPAQAKWITASGQAKITDNNVTQARENAIHQAVSYATLQSGARFSSQQTVSNGQLINDTFAMAHQAQSQNVELISERIENNEITVNVRIDII
ncbi:flagellar assembly protein T N-terminal domain-containing protein, partial [Shewanella sp. 0m-11]